MDAADTESAGADRPGDLVTVVAQRVHHRIGEGAGAQDVGVVEHALDDVAGISAHDNGF